MATLLREYEKHEEAVLVMRGTLSVLNLFDCGICDDGAEIVAAFLKGNGTVKKVWLSSCKIGSRGVQALAEALKLNETVELRQSDWR